MAPEEAEVDEHKPQGDLLPQGAPNALLGMAPAPDTLQPYVEDLWLPYHEAPPEEGRQDDNAALSGQGNAAGSGPSHHEISIHVADLAEDRPVNQTGEVAEV